MRENIKRFLFGGDAFKKDFVSQIKSLVVFTLGFTIAFSWRQTTFDTTEHFVQWLLHIQNSSALSILTSVVITLFSLLIIWIMLKLLDDY